MRLAVIIIIITSGQSNLTKDRIAAVDGQFSRIRQMASVYPAMWAHWHHLANTIKLCFLRPTGVHNPNSNSIGSAVSAQCMKVPTLYNHSCVLLNAGLCNALSETGICTSLESDFYTVSLPAALRAAQTCRYLVYSEADFEVRPAGATRCTDGGEIWHSSVPNFTPIGATTRV